MKRKLEFPLFYLVWVATVGELVFSVGKDNMLKIVITGVLALASTLMFVRVNSGTDDFIGVTQAGTGLYGGSHYRIYCSEQKSSHALCSRAGAPNSVAGRKGIRV